MRYRVYSGPRGSEEISPLDKERMLFKEFDNLDGALGWARHLADADRVPLLIEGDDGTRLGKLEIAAALPRGMDDAPALAGSERPRASQGRSTQVG
jgi:hypothetical protein